MGQLGPSYTTDSHHGWHINSCMVDAEYPYDGNSARLSTSYADAWIQSPYLPDGIGSISFRVAKTTTVNPIVAVEISSNGVSWTQIAATFNGLLAIPFTLSSTRTPPTISSGCATCRQHHHP